MAFQRSSMRYAHTNGHTSLTYTEDGQYIITCGSDGDIRKWKGIDDDDPSSNCLGEFVICIAHYEKRLLASTDLNTVQAYTFPEIDRDGTEMRFTAQVTCLKVNKNFIAAGSEDTTIKVTLRGKNDGEFILEGHSGPILSIDLSVNDLLASVSGDGCLKIWNLNEKKEVKTIAGLSKLKTFEDAKCFGTPSFEPLNGSCLAYVKGKEVIVLNSSTWETQFTLTDDNITSEYSCCQFSADGQFIAAGTRLGEISVFNFVRKQTVNCETSNSECHGITALAWNPTNNTEVAFCDSTGQLGTIVSGEVASHDLLDDAAMEENSVDNALNGFEFQNGDVEDEDDDNCVSLEKLKNETMRRNGLQPDEDSRDSKDSHSRHQRSVSVERPVARIYKHQPPFQPSSTPSDLEHRYLVWNNVGIVRAHSDDGEGSIDVEFHDASVHHSLHMTNYNNHTMASLSSTALALSGECSTKLVCIALAASGNKEWSVEMPDCEGVVALAASNKLVAVATDMRFLRIFSVMGTQREIISMPGPVLSMAAFQDRLMVCYHNSAASEDQHISTLLLQTIGLTVRTKEIRVPLLTARKLTWIGFSDCGSPVINDNMGLVQMFSMKTNCWYPVCDTMKQSQSVSNNFFIIDVSEKLQIIQAVLCRGCSYPMTNPRPMMTELPMQMPVCDAESERSGLEELLIRSSNFKVDNAEKNVKETAIKLFAIACRAEMEARAKELIEMIASPALLPLAVKYATKLGRIHLADKLSELLPQLEEIEKEREHELREIESDALGIIQNSPLNASLLLAQAARHSTQNTTPKLAPKPMVLSNQKRNPFKRTSVKPPPETTPEVDFIVRQSIDYELREKQKQAQLDEKARRDELKSKSSELKEKRKETFPSTQNSVIPDSQEEAGDENVAKNEIPPGMNFFSWFTKNKANLQKENPGVEGSELTKIAMKQFKELGGGKNSSSSPAPIPTAKRKLPTDDNSPKATTSSSKFSTFAKLTKFDFKN